MMKPPFKASDSAINFKVWFHTPFIICDLFPSLSIYLCLSPLFIKYTPHLMCSLFDNSSSSLPLL